MNPTTAVALAAIRDEPLSVDEVMAALRHPSAGALTLFVGRVRDHDHGKAVDVLEYSCHPSAAEVAHDVTTRYAGHDVVRVAVLHRVGRLLVGDLAVVVGVASEHRDAAFAVCRDLIDAFKTEVPIWKHQIFQDGSDEWVGLA